MRNRFSENLAIHDKNEKTKPHANTRQVRNDGRKARSTFILRSFEIPIKKVVWKQKIRFQTTF